MTPQQERSPKRSRKRFSLKTSDVPRGWVEVATAGNRMAAGMLESAVKAEGIPVMLRKPPLSVFTGAGGQHGVIVPEEHAEEAREILKDIWDQV